MNWLKKLRESLAYIEEHIMEELDTSEISKIAHVSDFHFLRMFHAITGMTLWEYIRKRRLSLAAREIARTSKKVIDIALDYGYANPESFTRAFRALHGVSPSKARQDGMPLLAFPPLTIQLTIKGEEPMEYRLEKKDRFTIRGISRVITTANEENFKQVPVFWSEVMEDGSFERLWETVNRGISYGVCADFDQSAETFSYIIGVEDLNQEEFERHEIPSLNWAIFTAEGAIPDAIQETFKRIYSEWFPATDFEHDEGPEIEVYLPGDTTSPTYRSEIWIPVKKK